MNTTKQIATHVHQVFFGGNWTWVNLKDTIKDINFEKANAEFQNCNTIAKLSFHVYYYVQAILAVLQNQPFNFHDKFSFDAPPITNEEDWQNLQAKIFFNAILLSEQIKKLPDEILPTTFVEEKYGTYHRNFLGLIEHTHYHLGQIALIKKLITK